MFSLKEIFENLKGRKVLKETIWSFLSKGISMLLFVILNVILARSLEVEEFGLWTIFFSVMTIVFSITNLGVNDSTRRFVAQYNKEELLKNVIKSSLKLRLLFSLVGTVLFLAFYRQIAVFLNRLELQELFLCGLPLIFLSNFVEYFKSVFMGLHMIKYNFFLNLTEYMLKLILVLVFFLHANSITSIINSFIVSLGIGVGLGFCLLSSRFQKKTGKNKERFEIKILKYSLPFIVINIGFLTLTEISSVMIGMYSSNTEVGIYGVAKNLVVKLVHISLAIAAGTMPIFAKLNEDNKTELKKFFYKILRYNMLLYLLISLVLIFSSPYFIPILFGKEYELSVLPLQILTIYLFGYSVSVILSTFLDYIGKAKIRAINILLTIVINIILNIILIPRYGAIGAAIATSSSYLPYVVINYFEVRRILK